MPTDPTPRTPGETLEARLREPMRLKGCTCLERVAPCPYCDESIPQYEREREEAADALAALREYYEANEAIHHVEAEAPDPELVAIPWRMMKRLADARCVLKGTD